MTSKNLVQITETMFADVLAALGLPSSSFSALFSGFLRGKINESFGILLEELRAGNMSELHVASENETVAVCYRYLLAARDGAARRNLRLLAKAMVGLAQRDQLYSDEFNKYAGVLENLTRDQIIYSAGTTRCTKRRNEKRMTKARHRKLRKTDWLTS